MPLAKLYEFIKKQFSGLAQPQRWFKDIFDSGPTAAGVSVTPENALTCSAVAACVRLLSESVASLPLFVYRQTETSKEKSSDHPLYWLLHDRPNSLQTSFRWRQLLMCHVLLHGNSYNFIERNDSGAVTAIWPLAPDRIVVKAAMGAAGILYEYFPPMGGERQVFADDQILHVRGLSLDGILGMSVIHMAREGIGLALTQGDHASSLFRNGARPGLFLKFPGMLGDKAKAALREGFEDKFAGALNHGKMVVLEGGVDLAPVGFTSEDAQFLQSREFSVQEICRWFRVSPTMVGDLSRSTYSNSEQEMLSFVQHSLRPWCVNLESEFNAKLFPERTQFFSEFELSGLARGDQAQRFESYGKALASGWMSVNEVRALENLPAKAGADELLTPANMLAGGPGGTPRLGS